MFARRRKSLRHGLGLASTLGLVNLAISVGACDAPPPASSEAPRVESAPLDSCGAQTTWVRDLREDFDDWDESRWVKADNLAVPDTETCHMASNVKVVAEKRDGRKTGDGLLRLVTRKEPGCGGAKYTGAGVTSYGKIWMGKYFKAEIRAKVSQEEGLFGAPLWFRPGDATGPTGVGGEIDIVESLGKWSPHRFQTTLHADYSDKPPCPDDASDCPKTKTVHTVNQYQDLGDPTGRDFHVYSVEKVPGGITFFTDGTWTAGWGCGHPKNEKAPPWYDAWFEKTPESWSLRMDSKAGGDWAGTPKKSTKWGPRTSVVIDFIKLYKPAPAG
jgi:hypothetical protein